MRALIFFCVLLGGQVFATEYTQQTGSSLSFTGSYQGEAFTGKIGRAHV